MGIGSPHKPTPRPNGEDGFTLIELMAVMMILALMTGAVVFALPDGPDGAELEARSIAKSLNLASRSALIEGQTHTFAISEDEWAVRHFDDGEWIDGTTGEFSDKVRLTLDAVPVDLTDTAIPYLIFEPSGQATPFKLELIDRDEAYVLLGTSDGAVRVERSDER